MAKLTSDGRDAMPDSGFAEPGKRAYPIEDKLHARNAKALTAQSLKAGRMPHR